MNLQKLYLPPQGQASQCGFSMKWEGLQESPQRTEEIWMFDGFGGSMDSQFSLKIWLMIGWSLSSEWLHTKKYIDNTKEKEDEEERKDDDEEEKEEEEKLL